MNTQTLITRGGPLAVLTAIVALAAAPAASQAANTPNCVPATNIQAIIDDSGSMSGEDPNKFRTALLDAFANLSQNNGTILGGIEFGTSPNVLFAPGTIPGIIPAMQASFLQVDANNGGTDYQEAFASATALNGTADARIFLTDGAPDSYPTTHLSPKVKTYVVGIGDFAASAGGNSVLTQIAAETGGPLPFLVQDSSQVQPVAAGISAAINCKTPPLTFTKTFTKAGEQVTYAFKPEGSTADILISWNTSSSVLDPTQFTVASGGKKGKKGSASLATLLKKGKAKVKRVRGTEKKGATFATVSLRGLKKGKKVKFKVKAATLVIPTIGTTQIIK